MKKNVGGNERWWRLGSGLAVSALYLLKIIPRNAFGSTVLSAGVTSLVTGLVGYCPINKAVGRDSSKESRLEKILHTL